MLGHSSDPVFVYFVLESWVDELRTDLNCKAGSSLLVFSCSIFLFWFLFINLNKNICYISNLASRSFNLSLN